MKEQEKKERDMRKELIPYSMFKSFSIHKLEKKLKNTHDEWTKENIGKQIKENTKQLEHLNRFKIILDNILEISDILKDKRLTREERKYYTQRREDFRTQLKEETRNDIIRRIEIKATLPKSKIKRKGPEGILGNPSFIRTWGICMFLFIIFGSLILISIVLNLKY